MTWSQKADDWYGVERQWNPRHGTGAGDQSNHGYQWIEKKEFCLESVNRAVLKRLNPNDIIVDIQKIEEAELDEMWSYVGHKGNQRWLWHAIDRETRKVLAYVTFGASY